LVVLYKEQAQYEKAEPLLLKAVEGRILKLGDTHPHTQESLNNVIALYEAWGKPEKAHEWRAWLRSAEGVPQGEAFDTNGYRGFMTTAATSVRLSMSQAG
jgi:hypothetical protein